ncbi:MAG: quinone-dependent dihydroorotate dehydrogenase [Pseudomonadota bacterium]
MVAKPWLYLSPEMAYKLAPLALRFHGTFFPTKQLQWMPLEWKGIRFDNRLGISGGVDKNAEHLKDWWSYGPGFLELGTVTPRPQNPNPGKIIDRNKEANGVWNKMGFPNDGLAKFHKRIKKIRRPYPTPVFINVGKNRDTSNENAHHDYIRGMLELVDYADAFVINISSPNTKGLRDLFNKDSLKTFLEPIFEARGELSSGAQKPMLLKLSPDHSDEELDNILQVSLDSNIDGWIFTNTSAKAGRQHGFPADGGVSGAPLSQLSKTALVKALARLGSDREGRLIVSSGGIMTPEQVFERLEMGADLVQVYSALIFEGPGFFEGVARQAQSR